MTTAPAIRSPEDLNLPKSEAMEAVFEALSEVGAKEFARAVTTALADAQRRNDFRPVQDVVLMWYRSLQFVQHDGFREAVQEANELVRSGERGMELADALKAWNLPEPTTP